MKKISVNFLMFTLTSLLFLFIIHCSKSAYAQTENLSVTFSEDSSVTQENIYARRGSFRSSSSRNKSSKTKKNKDSNEAQKKKTDEKKSAFGGMGGLITGLIGGALLASLLSGMGLEGLADFAGILMWGILGMLAFFLVKSFLAKRKKQETLETLENKERA